jgi:SIR2-like domain
MLDLTEIVLLTGAGISADAGVPLAVPLLENLLDNLTSSASSRPEVELARRLCRISTPAERRVRFEVAMEWIIELYDPDDELLSFLDSFDAPDQLHERIAVAAVRGATVMTVNFDDLLEQAVRRAGSEPYTVNVHRTGLRLPTRAVPVFKLHGTRRKWTGDRSEAATSLDAPAITGRDVSRLSPRLRLNEVAMRWLSKAVDGRDLIIVGYSGSDDLDIVPALRCTAPRSCYWVEYASHATEDRTGAWLAAHDGSGWRRLMRYLTDRGTEVHVLEGWPHETFDALGMPPALSSMDPSHPPDWQALLQPWLNTARAREPTGLALPGFLLAEVLHASEARACFVDASLHHPATPITPPSWPSHTTLSSRPDGGRNHVNH